MRMIYALEYLPHEVGLDYRSDVYKFRCTPAAFVPPISLVPVHRSTFLQARYTQPEVFESLGFTTLTEPCLVYDFAVDTTAEIMGTRASNIDDASSCMRG